MTEANHDYALTLALAAVKFGIEADKTRGWDGLVADIIVAMGGRCQMCGGCARILSCWMPSDATLLGSPSKRLLYLLCESGRHPLPEIERALAAKEAVAS